MSGNNWFKRNISKRNLIRKDESKVTYIQIIGFSLIAAGLLYMTIYRLVYHVSSSEGMAISFFVIMLGMSFAFPSLLEGYDKQLSTMRIVVFMMVNVICILLVKIGWSNEVKSLKDIGLNEYWMGVIAFIFGAKATQSYFESRLARSTDESADSESKATDDTPIATVRTISEAIKVKGKEWVESFPNVTGLSVRNKTTGGEEKNDIALVFKVVKKENDINYGEIPKYIHYASPDGRIYKILTDVEEEEVTEGSSSIIENKAPFPLGNSISRNCQKTVTGSIGLVLKRKGEPNTDYILSCYHVFCYPELCDNNKSYKSAGNSAKLICASLDDDGTNLVGSVVTGLMNEESDFAIARVNNGVRVDNGSLTLKAVPASFGFVFDENRGDEVIVCGRSSGRNSGAIKSTSAAQTVFYCNRTRNQFYTNLIEVEAFSQGGDSGGVVIDKMNRVIGLVIAGNSQSSYVLPVKEFLLKNKYSLKTA